MDAETLKVRILQGDCRETLRELTVQGLKAQCCVTSPPYYGLRDYGHPGQIGLEKTPAEYVAALVEVFRCVRDVLADDGVLWLNLGDSYAASRSYQVSDNKNPAVGPSRHAARSTPPEGLKPKDLIGIPWRVAFALQADGWYLRQDIIWHKLNPMPESVRDRCTKAHEYMFLLAKSERYYWDAEAMQEPAVSEHGSGNGFAGRQGGAVHLPMSGGGGTTEPWKPRSKRDTFKREASKRAEVIPGQTVGTHRPDREESTYDVVTRNKRSVWTVATRPYKGAHFATFPPALVEPCILAGSRPGDVVLDPFCGSGTTGAVALQHGRRFVGSELNPDYIKLAWARIDPDSELWL